MKMQIVVDTVYRYHNLYLYLQVNLGTYSCSCSAGYTGENCTEVIDYCKDDPCVTEHTEQCISGTTDYTCQCKLGEIIFSLKFCVCHGYMKS